MSRSAGVDAIDVPIKAPAFDRGYAAEVWKPRIQSIGTYRKNVGSSIALLARQKPGYEMTWLFPGTPTIGQQRNPPHVTPT